MISVHFGSVSVRFGSVGLRLAPFWPFRVCFGSVSGPFWGVGWGRGGVGERGFCKGKKISLPSGRRRINSCLRGSGFREVYKILQAPAFFYEDLQFAVVFAKICTSQRLMSKNQKTREGCGCFRGLCRSSAGKFRENSGKIAGKFFPESRNATNSRISGTGKGKPAGNLGSTLPGPCPHLPCGVFFEIDSSSLLEFF